MFQSVSGEPSIHLHVDKLTVLRKYITENATSDCNAVNLRPIFTIFGVLVKNNIPNMFSVLSCHRLCICKRAKFKNIAGFCTNN